ncbi:hypothetical protein ACFSUD_00440 [Sulfitobacter aestuarii]|uniref:DUF3035 domain-containing protein n=1 Tax=Sulfitobacter aestuarii TaxID=2161676 RepID=A0ABW5TWL0_9RHOB
MKSPMIAGALSLTLGACSNAPAFFADPTSVYVQQPTPLPELSALQAAAAPGGTSHASAESPFAGYQRYGVVEPLDWRRLNAEQAPKQEQH